MHADTSNKNGQRGEQNLLDLGVRRRESRKKEVKGGFLYPWERGERGKSDNESRLHCANGEYRREEENKDEELCWGRVGNS